VSTSPYPAAAVVSIRTDGHHVNQLEVHCPFCRGRHTHEWFDEPGGLRSPTCGAPGAMYVISVGVRERIDAMRTEFPAPNGVVGLVPLHIGYAYEQDGDEDIIGVVLETALGRFAVWLPMASAVGLAGQLVDIADNAEQLRTAYLQRAQADLTG
jgi:hypothetical protein